MHEFARSNLWHKFLRLVVLCYLFLACCLRVVYLSHVFLQLILPLELLAAVRAMKLSAQAKISIGATCDRSMSCFSRVPVIGMFQQVHSQLVDRRETLRAVLTLVLPLAMVCPNVFANNRILNERSLAVRAAEYTVLISVRLNVILQHRALAKQLPAHWTLEDLLVLCESTWRLVRATLIVDSSRAHLYASLDDRTTRSYS